MGGGRGDKGVIGGEIKTIILVAVESMEPDTESWEKVRREMESGSR